MVGIRLISITFFMTFSINAIFYYFKEEFAPEKAFWLLFWPSKIILQ